MTALPSFCTTRSAPSFPLVPLSHTAKPALVYRTRFPAPCISASGAAEPLVAEFQSAVAPWYSTRFPSLCRPSLYSPLQEVSDSPKTRAWPTSSVPHLADGCVAGDSGELLVAAVVCVPVGDGFAED